MQAVTGWQDALVVRDRLGQLRHADGFLDGSVTAGLGPLEIAVFADTFGPMEPILDRTGHPIVCTVGDLTARHIGKRVRVETDRTLPDRVRLLREIATASTEAVLLTLEVIDHPEWFLMAHFDLDTPCEVLE